MRLDVPCEGLDTFGVAACDAAGVRLASPLEPNINHRGTVFCGSASVRGMLAGWALVGSFQDTHVAVTA